MKNKIMNTRMTAFFLFAVLSCKKQNDQDCNDLNTGAVAPTRVTFWMSKANFNGRTKLTLDSIYNLTTGKLESFANFGRTHLLKGYDAPPDCNDDSTACVGLEKGYEYEYYINLPQGARLRGTFTLDCSAPDCTAVEVIP